MCFLFQALYFLPLLLYKLGKEDLPEVKQHVLYTIPQLATHKVQFCLIVTALFIVNYSHVSNE